MSQEHRSKPAGGRNRLESIDILRGLAALAVLLCHIKHHVPNPVLDLRWLLVFPLDFGSSGVTLFVVISGFCIHLAVARNMERGEAIRADWGKFWRRRIHRLYPPYLAAIVLSLIAYRMSRPEYIGAWERITSPAWDLVAHLFMVHNLSPHFWSGAGDFPLWTLGMEEQLYLLYFLYLLLRSRLRTKLVLPMVLCVSVLWTLGMRTMHFNGPLGWFFGAGHWGFWPFGFWFNWVLGAIAAEAYTGVVKLPEWCYRKRALFAALIAGLAIDPSILGRVVASRLFVSWSSVGPIRPILANLTLLSRLMIGTASFVLLNQCIRAELAGRFRFPWRRSFAAIGVFSYSLYLTHVPVLRLAESTLRWDDGLLSLFLRYLLFAPLCVGAAYAFFLLVEQRFLNRGAVRSPAPHGADVPLPSLSDGRVVDTPLRNAQA